MVTLVMQHRVQQKTVKDVLARFMLNRTSKDLLYQCIYDIFLFYQGRGGARGG